MKERYVWLFLFSNCFLVLYIAYRSISIMKENRALTYQVGSLLNDGNVKACESELHICLNQYERYEFAFHAMNDLYDQCMKNNK